MKAKKSLGQNFLKSEKALGDMVRAGNISEQDVVLEIGPGKGALTERLVKLAGKVIAIEKDRELVPLLKEQFAEAISADRLEVLERDILEFDETVLREYGRAYKLVANIPYYITGAIIRKFLESDFQPTSMTLLVQKEVAERIVARDGKESILSISVKAYGAPHYIDKVPKRYFSPEPAVDSAIIHIDGISKRNFKDVSEQAFFTIVKAAFGQKRKTLANNLAHYRDPISIEGRGIDPKARAEDLKLADFFKLSRELTGLSS